jgi:hypothetical protein
METRIPDYIDDFTFDEEDKTAFDGKTLFINTISVRHAERGKGLFHKFINELKQEYAVILLECWPTLIPMYMHLGFEVLHGEYDGYYEMIWKKQ